MRLVFLTTSRLRGSALYRDHAIAPKDFPQRWHDDEKDFQNKLEEPTHSRSLKRLKDRVQVQAMSN